MSDHASRLERAPLGALRRRSAAREVAVIDIGSNSVRLVVYRLDGRAMKPGHDEHGGGDMSVRSATYDKAGKQLTESAVDLRVCECCPTTAAVTADGPIVAYRDRSDTEIRDIYVARFVGGKWSEPAPVHRDNWQIAACPVNGPALTADGKLWFPTSQGLVVHDPAVEEALLAASARDTVKSAPERWLRNAPALQAGLGGAFFVILLVFLSQFWGRARRE